MMAQLITSFLMEYLSIYTSTQFILVKVTPNQLFPQLSQSINCQKKHVITRNQCSRHYSPLTSPREIG